MAQGFGGLEKFAEIEDAEQAGAAEGGIVDLVGSGKRPGVRGGRLGCKRVPAGLDHHHRTCVREAARAADMNFRASLIDST